VELQLRHHTGSPLAIKREDIAVRRQAIATPDPVRRQIETVLRPLAFSGPCNVDYKLLADGRMQIFEINPRLGGTPMLPAEAMELRAALACIIEHATA
jgi:carbamoylphosphate synthase large subunit